MHRNARVNVYLVVNVDECLVLAEEHKVLLQGGQRRVNCDRSLFSGLHHKAQVGRDGGHHLRLREVYTVHYVLLYVRDVRELHNERIEHPEDGVLEGGGRVAVLKGMAHQRRQWTNRALLAFQRSRRLLPFINLSIVLVQRRLVEHSLVSRHGEGHAEQRRKYLASVH